MRWMIILTVFLIVLLGCSNTPTEDVPTGDAIPIFSSDSTANIREGLSLTTVVYDAQATFGSGSIDASIQYTLGGTDSSFFTIDADNGEVRLKAPANFETRNSYDIEITATATGANGNVATQSVISVMVTVTSPYFILKITTKDNTFTFYTQDDDYDIDWDNDGIFDMNNASESQSHTFDTAGKYTVAFRNLNNININDQADKEKYTSIEQWGTAVWNANMSSAFRGASKLVGNYRDTPNMGNVSDMSRMFEGADTFNQSIGTWNVGKVTIMSSMFKNATSFNQDIGTWNVANVTNMFNMFGNATSFKQSIGTWNVANVTNMGSMFDDATSFNQDIGTWNVEKVIDMSGIFNGATSFNQDIGTWNVVNVTTMNGMFSNATSFNQDIGTWNVGKVTTMFYMFSNAISFNQDIRNWNVASVTNMLEMFDGATSFNQQYSPF